MFGPVMSSSGRVGEQATVVGDEVLDLRLDHRMAAGLDLDQAGSSHELRPRIAARRAPCGEGRTARRACASARAMRCRRRHVRLQRVEQLFVERLLERQRPVARRERLVLECLQLRRDVALGVLQRLAAPVIVRAPSRLARCVTSM